MEIIQRRLPRNHNIVIAGDWHLGNSMTFLEGIRDMVDYIRTTENTYYIPNGDLAEGITHDDKRFNFQTSTGEYDPTLQALKIVDILEPIREKIIVINTGNHEWKLIKYGDITKNIICRELNVPYGTFSCKVHILDENTGELMYKIFVSHGFKSIDSSADSRRRKGTNEELMLERRLRNKASDCLVMCMGHTHKLIVSEPIHILYLTDDGERIKANYTDVHETAEYIHPEHRWYVNTGSFLKLYERGISGYAELAGYDPVDLGYPIIECVDGKINKIRKRYLV